VFLAIIGPRWSKEWTSKAPADRSIRWLCALSNLSALKRIIPVSVNNAEMPRGEDLPDNLKPLADRNAFPLSPNRFDRDCQGLVEEIRVLIGETEPEHAIRVKIASSNEPSAFEEFLSN
jgi:hypothetical protein